MTVGSGSTESSAGGLAEASPLVGLHACSVLFAVAVLVAAGCSATAPRGDGASPTTSPTAVPRPGDGSVRATAPGLLVEPPAEVASTAITELSGLAASVSLEGVLWGHNDSGAPATVYAIGADGSGRAAHQRRRRRGHRLGRHDAGPRSRRRLRGVLALRGRHRRQLQPTQSVTVYGFREPDPADGTATAFGVELVYPDGPHDAESLLSDPVSGDLFIVTKEQVNRREAEGLPSGSTASQTRTSPPQASANRSGWNGLARWIWARGVS